MSHPIPTTSSIPRVTNGQRIVNMGTVGHAAANLLPAVTHIKKIGQKLDESLKQTHVYDQIRALLKQYMNEESLDASKQDEVLSSLRSAGLFGDVLAGGVGPQVGFGYDATGFDPSLIGGVAASAALPGGGRIVPGKRYLNVRVRSGKAFVENILDDAEAKVGGFHVLRLSMEFQGSRCISAPVPATVEPNFNENFLFKLQDEEREMEGLIPLEQLAELNVPLHLLIIRESSLGTTTLVSSARIEWRKVLVHGRLSLNVELKGGDELQIPVGLISLDLEILPLKMPSDPKTLPIFIELNSLNKQLARDQELTHGVDQRFHAYAKAWWNDYNCIRPLHQTRLIQIFGLDETKSQKCVCTFLTPIRADRCLDSPLHAARFVRLIPYTKDVRIGGQRTEVWHSPYTTLARRCGDLEDHAILLCSLLLGFGLDAYVAIGTTYEKGAHIWVVTLGAVGANGSQVTMWESLTGQRFELDQSAEQRALIQAGLNKNGTKVGVSPAFPFAKLHCLFNHRSFYANNQLEDEVSLIDYNLPNPASWKPMNERAIEVLQRKSPIFLRAPALDARAEERALERKMKELIVNYRREYGNLSTSWSEDFSYILGPALSSYENERITGQTFGNDEFQQAIKRTVPNNCVFKGVPFQFTSLNPSILFASTLNSRALVDLLTADGTDLRFGLRVKVIAYPEDYVAVWLMIASIKKADDFLTAPTPTYQ